MEGLRTRKEERAIAAAQRAKALEDKLALAKSRVDASRMSLLRALNAGDGAESLREELDTMKSCISLAQQSGALQETVAKARSLAATRIEKWVTSALLVERANRTRRETLEQIQLEIQSTKASIASLTAEVEALHLETRRAFARLKDTILHGSKARILAVA
jgi:hypothetical protein